MVKDRGVSEKGFLYQRPALKTRKSITSQPTQIELTAEKQQIAALIEMVKGITGQQIVFKKAGKLYRNEVAKRILSSYIKGERIRKRDRNFIMKRCPKPGRAKPSLTHKLTYANQIVDLNRQNSGH